METVEIVRVKFRWPGKMYEFLNDNNLVLKRADKVLVENYRGGSMVGTVSVPPRIRMKRKEDGKLSSVIRQATEQDIKTSEFSDEFRRDLKNFFNTRLSAQNVSGVKLVDCERADGGQKLIVYYSSENKRFESRAMAKDLGGKFGMKIDMRSVGVRDAARLSGGIGKCGLSTCCSTWLPDFNTVSIRMAKDQGLSLDPESINGQCGRLLCCLGYEHENYLALVKGLPKVGKVVITPAGEGRVTKLDVLKRIVTVRHEDGAYENYTGDDVTRKFAPQSDSQSGERPGSREKRKNSKENQKDPQ